MNGIQWIGTVLQEQILGMKWLNGAIGGLLSGLGVDVSTRLGGSLQFFLYDVIKITVLLCVMIFVISYIQSYFPPERSRSILGRFHGIGANLIAALLGTVTPFCSCSSCLLYTSRFLQALRGEHRDHQEGRGVRSRPRRGG